MIREDIELKAKDAYKNMCEEACEADYRLKVMLEYESSLPGLTADMVFWWWDNMGPIERYRMWSPDHLSFEWEIDPSVHGHKGAVHRVIEYVGDAPVILRLRYEDPESYPGTRKYGDAIVESVLTNDEKIMGWVLHEFQDVENGLVMRNVFHLVEGTHPEIIDGIRTHSKAEMERLPQFLPGLYEEYSGVSE